MANDADTPWADEQTVELFEQALAAAHAGLSIDAAEKAEQLFAIAQEWIAKSPPPGWDLVEAAIECELRRDWQGVERACLAQLQLAEKSTHSNRSAHGDLAALSRLLGRQAAELEHCKHASSAARNSGSYMLLLMALRGEARALLRSNRIDEAEAIVSEAFDILRLEEESYTIQLRASHLVLRARCACVRNRLVEAQDDLDRAMELLEPMSCVEVAGGVQSDLWAWWIATAELRELKQDFPGAFEAMESAVVKARHVHSLEQCASAYTLFSLAETLDSLAHACVRVGDIKSANAATNEAASIRQSLKLPTS